MGLADDIVAWVSAGELQAAAHAYEEGGAAIGEQLYVLLAKDGRLALQGARMFALARDYARSARLSEHLKRWPDAAKMREAVGDAAGAARCWKKSGDEARAARAYDAAGEVDEAAALYAKLGEHEAQARCLARAQRWLEAAHAYRVRGNLRGELDVLQQVPVGHRDRVAATQRLAEILASRNRAAEAVEIVSETIRDDEQARGDPDLHRLLASLMQSLGHGAQAERLRVRADRLQRRAATDAPETGNRFLRAIPIFARLAIDDMRDLLRLATEVQFAPGKEIVEAGVDAPGLTVIVEGTAEVYADGARHLNSVGPGAHLGEISLLSKSITSARVVASTAVRALRIDRATFEQFLETHPAAALRIYRLFSETLAERVRALSL